MQSQRSGGEAGISGSPSEEGRAVGLYLAEQLRTSLAPGTSAELSSAAELSDCSTPLAPHRFEYEEEASLVALGRGLNDIIEQYQHFYEATSWEMEVTLLHGFDARKQIEHYLNGFQGQLQWFGAMISVDLRYHRNSGPEKTRLITNLFIHLKEHQARFRLRAVPLHRGPSAGTLTETQMADLAVFDAFIAMKEQTERCIAPEGSYTWEPRYRWEPRFCRDLEIIEWKLLVEQIGVLIDYPTLEGQQWLSGQQWLNGMQRGRGPFYRAARRALDALRISEKKSVEDSQFWNEWASLVPMLDEFLLKYRTHQNGCFSR